MWSIWTAPVQIKVSAEAAAGQLRRPLAGNCIRGCGWGWVQGCAGRGGRKDAVLKSHRDLGQALFGDDHLFLSVLHLPAELSPRDALLEGTSGCKDMRT